MSKTLKKDLSRCMTEKWYTKDQHTQQGIHSTSQIMKEVQTEATIIYLYTLTEVANLKMADDTKCWQEWETAEILILSLWQ